MKYIISYLRYGNDWNVLDSTYIIISSAAGKSTQHCFSKVHVETSSVKSRWIDWALEQNPSVIWGIPI